MAGTQYGKQFTVENFDLADRDGIAGEGDLVTSDQDVDVRECALDNAKKFVARAHDGDHRVGWRHDNACLRLCGGLSHYVPS